MKFLLIILVVVSYTFNTVTHVVKINHVYADTTHIVDGNIGEWRDTAFSKDATTNISYAVDNTKEFFFVALKITDQRMQLKLMRLGMDMYIDTKGKHKEGMGIGFPVKNENTPTPQFNRNADGSSGGRPDFKAIRQQFAMNLFSVKLFGFDGVEDKTQGLAVEGSANVAFNWDDKDVMYVEYSIPLKFIGSEALLKGKKISVGWKINGVETSSTNNNEAVTSGSRLVAVPAGSSPSGGRSGSGRGFSPSSSSSGSFDNAMKEQSIWGKYDIKL